MALTPRQKQVLDFIADFVRENGYCPSYEEIGRGLGLASLATVHKHISALEARGYLMRSFNQSRSLELSAKYLEEIGERGNSKASLEIPLAGRIAAGSPVESFESAETISFGDLVGGQRYALAVRGESMIDDHICDGDYVLVEKTSQVRNGEIVVALVGGSESTLKRFYSEPGGMVRLQPANAAMDPIRVPASNVEIQGRVLAVLRKY
jgi:repressor LexA